MNKIDLSEDLKMLQDFVMIYEIHEEITRNHLNYRKDNIFRPFFKEL